jgi:hypothetical protein
MEDDSTMGTHQEFQWAKRIADGPVRVTRKVDLKMGEAGFHLLVMATRTLDPFGRDQSTRFAPAKDSYQLVWKRKPLLRLYGVKVGAKRAKREMKPRQ